MKLKVSFNEVNSSLEMEFIQNECIFTTNFGEVTLVETNEVYEGDYEVTPRVYSQMLKTKGKFMIDNVLINVIPIAKTINLSNGYTVTIG